MNLIEDEKLKQKLIVTNCKNIIDLYLLSNKFILSLLNTTCYSCLTINLGLLMEPGVYSFAFSFNQLVNKLDLEQKMLHFFKKNICAVVMMMALMSDKIEIFSKSQRAQNS